MARIIQDQKNVWGAQGGPEPQRSDLWQVDFDNASTALFSLPFALERLNSTAVHFAPFRISRFYAQSLALPSLAIRPQAIRRDSRPYQTPSWDEPLDSIRMTFILDTAKPGNTADPYQSEIYALFDLWRAVVRAGRGAFSNEPAFTLDANYRVNYAYDVNLLFLKGSKPTVTSTSDADITKQERITASSKAGLEPGRTPETLRALTVPANLNAGVVNNDLEISTKLILVKTWISSFQVNELNYDAAKVVLLTAQFYAEDIQQVPILPP